MPPPSPPPTIPFRSTVADLEVVSFHSFNRRGRVLFAPNSLATAHSSFVALAKKWAVASANTGGYCCCSHDVDDDDDDNSSLVVLLQVLTSLLLLDDYGAIWHICINIDQGAQCE